MAGDADLSCLFKSSFNWGGCESGSGSLGMSHPRKRKCLVQRGLNEPGRGFWHHLVGRAGDVGRDGRRKSTNSARTVAVFFSSREVSGGSCELRLARLLLSPPHTTSNEWSSRTSQKILTQKNDYTKFNVL